MVRCRRKGIQGDGGGGADVDWRMAGHDDASASGTMLGDRTFEPRLIFMVERASRFVEEPYRRRRRDQTGERDPSTLARGKPATWPVGNPVERERGQRSFEQARRAARFRTPERCPERQGFARREAGFDAILMADKVQLCAIGGALCLDRRNAPEEPAAGRGYECGDDTQQAGFAAAIRSGEEQGASCRQAKRQSGKDQALAAPASEALGDQILFGQSARRTKRRLRWGKTGAAWPRSNCSTEYEVWGTNL
jgi:hypothetical protein